MNVFATAHGCGQNCFHFVWKPKYAYRILEGEVKSECERVFREVACTYRFVIKELQVMSDHVHVFVGLRPDQSFPIVGRSVSGAWWQVERNSSGATCWVWTDLVDICGNTDDVEVIGIQEKDEVIEEEVPEDPAEEPPDVPPAEFQACHDYPDFGTCTSDPMGFGGCSWDTGQSQCVP